MAAMQLLHGTLDATIFEAKFNNSNQVSKVSSINPSCTSFARILIDHIVNYSYHILFRSCNSSIEENELPATLLLCFHIVKSTAP
jgi:hypothetical protein